MLQLRTELVRMSNRRLSSTNMTESSSSSLLLSSTAATALEFALAFISETLAFPIFELWLSNHQEEGKLVYCHQNVLNKHPWIKTGYQQVPHPPSILRTIEQLQTSESPFRWMNVNSSEEQCRLSSSNSTVKSEFALLISSQSPEDEPLDRAMKILLVGFSIEQQLLSSSKLQFLQSISSAIAISVTLNEDLKKTQKEKLNNVEETVLKKNSFSKNENQRQAMEVASRKKHLPALDFAELNDQEASLFLTGSQTRLTSSTNSSRSDDSSIFTPSSPLAQLISSVPSYPVQSLPIKRLVKDDFTWNDFSNVTHLADGSNANVYVGTCIQTKRQVILKLIQEKEQSNPVVMKEFETEYDLLCRVDHPNIVKVLGAGKSPRRFIVLEYLAGGTMGTLLSKNDRSKSQGFASKMFHRSTFSYSDMLIRAREVADALDYLHRRCQTGVCILHRDLKPENIGFTEDGYLKLFDFGLISCVKPLVTTTDTYQMTGNTGSLRYMAPEVAKSAPYNEKVDVYSFGILLWQMASDRVPFKGFNKQEFMKTVVQEGSRPKLDSSWPPEFASLLVSCWHQDARSRPTFEGIVLQLDQLLSSSSKPRSRFVSFRLKPMGKPKVSPSVLISWF